MTVLYLTNFSLRFYAPWCGHCRNLKPAYEKAAKSLDGLAQVAAVNCDDEINKPFCGGMGVQGFPTLKLVKPGKTLGKPVIEDYQGERSAKGIVEAVKQAIPNHVKRITDKGLGAWLQADNETAKAILFSDKGTTSALTKVLASEYLGNMNFAQIRNKEAAAIEMFGISTYPSLVVLPGGNKAPVLFEGSYSKDAMTEFLSQFAEPKVAPSVAKASKKPKPTKSSQAKPSSDSETASSSFSEASSAHKVADKSSEAAGATTITLGAEGNPTESPEPIAQPEDAPKPAPILDLPPPIFALVEQSYLEKQCLNAKSTTCILALLPDPSGEDGSVLPDSANVALESLAQIAEKHKQRGSKLFPFYSVPNRNAGVAALRSNLELKDSKDIELIAINARRGWWRHFNGDSFEVIPVEAWVDGIRLGEGSKSKLPEGIVVEDKAAVEDHDEL